MAYVISLGGNSKLSLSHSSALTIIAECESRYQELIDGGCVDDVAADRVFDALECALEKEDMHCFDPRDRLFENKLRTIAQKGDNHGKAG